MVYSFLIFLLKDAKKKKFIVYLCNNCTGILLLFLEEEHLDLPDDGEDDVMEMMDLIQSEQVSDASPIVTTESS